MACARDHQAICDYRKSQRHRRPAVPWHRYPRAVGTGLRQRDRGAGRQRRRGHAGHGDEYTPTPAVSHAILTYNRGRSSGLADGIVVTPSHNPPDNGGFKYNPPNGGPADEHITDAIENAANALLETDLNGVKRMPYAPGAARGNDASTTTS